MLNRTLTRSAAALAAGALFALVPSFPARAADEAKPGQAAAAPAAAPSAPAAASLDRLKALAGDWVDSDGSMGMKGQVAVTYRVTGAGSAVVETQFVGTDHEMVSVYHKDGNDLVMTHYCAAGNQPRLRARKVAGDVIAFDFDGGTNLDPAKDTHIHSARVELLSADEVRSVWTGWAGGKPGNHEAEFHLKRKKG